jgi:hypothetical protein
MAFALAVPLTLVALVLTILIPELPLRKVAHVNAASVEGSEIPAAEPSGPAAERPAPPVAPWMAPPRPASGPTSGAVGSASEQAQ